jgi:hypothetical protein
MKRFLIDTSVENAEGSQTWYVDAKTEEEALAKFESGDCNIYESNVEVTKSGEPEISGAVPLDDFGRFAEQPPAAPNVQEPVKFSEELHQERERRQQLEAELMRMQGRELQLQMALNKPEAQPAPVQEPLSFNCSAGCGACGVKLQDFVTHQTQAQEGDEWVVVATQPKIVSTCCGSPVDVWDERKQDITASVDATPPAAQPAPVARSVESVDYIPHGWPDWMKPHGITKGQP